jgi:hypothetical protein
MPTVKKQKNYRLFLNFQRKKKIDNNFIKKKSTNAIFYIKTKISS